VIRPETVARFIRLELVTSELCWDRTTKKEMDVTETVFILATSAFKGELDYSTAQRAIARIS
jgi:hypothetical protein